MTSIFLSSPGPFQNKLALFFSVNDHFLTFKFAKFDKLVSIDFVFYSGKAVEISSDTDFSVSHGFTPIESDTAAAAAAGRERAAYFAAHSLCWSGKKAQVLLLFTAAFPYSFISLIPQCHLSLFSFFVLSILLWFSPFDLLLISIHSLARLSPYSAFFLLLNMDFSNSKTNSFRMTHVLDKLFEEIAPAAHTPHRKVTIVGVGQVGMACAYSILQQVDNNFVAISSQAMSFLLQNIASEICLVDVVADKLKGEMMDLQHGLPFVKNCVVKADTGNWPSFLFWGGTVWCSRLCHHGWIENDCGDCWSETTWRRDPPRPGAEKRRHLQGHHTAARQVFARHSYHGRF